MRPDYVLMRDTKTKSDAMPAKMAKLARTLGACVYGDVMPRGRDVRTNEWVQNHETAMCILMLSQNRQHKSNSKI